MKSNNTFIQSVFALCLAFLFLCGASIAKGASCNVGAFQHYATHAKGANAADLRSACNTVITLHEGHGNVTLEQRQAAIRVFNTCLEKRVFTDSRDCANIREGLVLLQAGGSVSGGVISTGHTTSASRTTVTSSSSQRTAPVVVPEGGGGMVTTFSTKDNLVPEFDGTNGNFNPERALQLQAEIADKEGQPSIGDVFRTALKVFRGEQTTEVETRHAKFQLASLKNMCLKHDRRQLAAILQEVMTKLGVTESVEVRREVKTSSATQQLPQLASPASLPAPGPPVRDNSKVPQKVHERVTPSK